MDAAVGGAPWLDRRAAPRGLGNGRRRRVGRCGVDGARGIDARFGLRRGLAPASLEEAGLVELLQPARATTARVVSGKERRTTEREILGTA